MSRLLAAFVLGCLVTPTQEEEFGRLIPAKDAGGGERLQFSPVTADLDALRAEIPGFTLVALGSDVLEVRRAAGSFTDAELRDLRRIVRAHHEARAKAGKSGIEERPRRAAAPEEWRRKYAAARDDAERLRIVSEYLGLDSK